ncbi:MAG: glycerophosphodiester phosphodiesterase family protein [Lachnospiraceae bacterium]
MFIYVMLTVIAFILLYLFAVMPQVYHRPDTTKFMGHFYAHRGLHDNHSSAPENSFSAFQKAVDAGYGIELDVQLTKDNKVVVFHDESLKRMCEKPGKIRNFTYEELCDLLLLNSDQGIPLLRDVLSVVDGRIPLIVEIKIHEKVGTVCAKVNDELKDYRGPYVVESFHPLAVAWYRMNCPHIIRGQLASNFMHSKNLGIWPVYFVVQNLLSNFIAKPHFISYDCRYRNALSFLICRKLFHTLSVAWTVKDQKTLNSCRELFDLFIFEGFIPQR